MSGDFLPDYIDVPGRIAKFIEKYPEGSLQTISWSVEHIGEATFIVYRAAAYRTPTDRRPGHGTAWEPFPGPSSYTKDSELMNAETAAWGRAIVACGLPASKKIASEQEVKARQENGTGNGKPLAEVKATVAEAPMLQAVATPPKQSGRPATAKQREQIQNEARAHRLGVEQLANVLVTAGDDEMPRVWTDEASARRWIARALDRLPAGKVTAVLAAINGAGEGEAS